MKPIRIALLAACLVWLAAPALSTEPEFTFATIELPEADCGSPSIASSDSGVTVVSFTERGVVTMEFISTIVVPTRTPVTSLPDGAGDKFPDFWGTPVTVAAGTASEVCWSREGFTLASTDGLMITLIQGDREGVWDLAGSELLPAGGDVGSLDLWGDPDPGEGPAVFLTWTVFGPMGPYTGDARCYFSMLTESGWSEPELVAEDLRWACSQVTWAAGPDGPLPQVFFPHSDGSDIEMRHRTRHPDTGWQAPVSVIDTSGENGTCYGDEFKVVTTDDQEMAILGLGPLPVCPCGTIHHQYTSAGLWQPCEEWTINYGTLDQPISPRLCAGADGQLHAFWYQVRSSSDLIANRAYLEYRVGQGEQWEDAGDFLDAEPRSGLHSQLALNVSPEGYPVLAWARRDTIDEVEQHQVIRLARHKQPGPSPVPDAPATPALRAWPNPFNPRVSLSFDLEREQDLQLTVFDARGRLVRRLIAGTRPAGNLLTVWNGRDDQGASVPSGVYFARLETATGVFSRKLVLAR